MIYLIYMNNSFNNFYVYVFFQTSIQKLYSHMHNIVV